VTLSNVLQTISAPMTGTGSALTLTFTADADGGSEAFAFQNLIIQSGTGGGPIDPPFGVCADSTETLIHVIQGSAAVSPEEGNKHVVEGVVVGDYQDTATELSGFFLQEEDGQVDGDPATSEGLFIFDNGFGVDVEVGDVVRVKGEVDEAFGLTQLESITDLVECADKVGGASEAAVTLPVAVSLEPYEGMLIHIDQTLYATDNRFWHSFGEVTLSVGGVLDNPTDVVPPGAPAHALQDLNNRSSVQLDDGSSLSNSSTPPLDPPTYISADGTMRRGDTIPSLKGVLGYAFGAYEVHPTETVSFTRTNDRVGPPDVGGTIQVGAFNVLNYFPTIDTGASICGPLSDQGCRGADSTSEFDRQRAKIIDAIVKLDAEVLGLMEIENAPDNTPEADLVSGLNAVAGAGTYDYIATGAVGSDAIRVAILYQPGEVTPVGSFAVLDTSVDPTFNDDKNRAVLAQTFEENATGEIFTVAVNHLKSKGSSCNDVGDPDAGDLQGNCNGVRTDGAIAQANWLATDPTGSGDPDFLITGDLNSYAQEDPIVALEAKGYTDLIQLFEGLGGYSFTFDGQSGYLDHAMATSGLTDKVTGAAFWHINADEPRSLDYNEDQGYQPSLYNPDEWRASDHDPVLVGLDMANPMGMKSKAMKDLEALLPTGDSRDDRSIEKAISLIDASLDSDLWLDDSHLNEKGWLVFIREWQAVHHLTKVRGATAEAQAAIDLLLQADEILAQTAIDLAIASGGDSKDIGRAQHDLAKAVDHVARDRFSHAVRLYGKAWHRAMKGMEDARFATFNASLNRGSAGALALELSTAGSNQPATIAEIIQRTRPQVLLINEFDYDGAGTSARLFQRNYLSVSQNGADPIDYPFHYTAPSNTGIFSGFDLDNSGAAGDFVPNDSFGFGFFPGQYGMAVYSMYPIDVDDVRTFQHFLWKDMPGAMLPDDPATPDPADWYSAAELDVFRLSSKSHWDVPIQVGLRSVHFLVSHPTPPVFDGPEDRNGTRNFDEIRFWADYIDPDLSDYIYDDDGAYGGLHGHDLFVIAGDQNSDPLDGDSIPGAIQQLLDHGKINTKVTPSSDGAVEQAVLQGGANDSHLSDPAYDTADFSDFAPGNLRADYVLPRNNMKIYDAGVFWPESSDPLFSLVGTFPFPSSDHRLVWIDVRVKGR
jgi:predicted extracellular nuclease